VDVSEYLVGINIDNYIVALASGHGWAAVAKKLVAFSRLEMNGR